MIINTKDGIQVVNLMKENKDIKKLEEIKVKVEKLVKIKLKQIIAPIKNKLLKF